MRGTKFLFLVVVLMAVATGLGNAQNAPAANSSERRVTSRVQPFYPELAKKMNIHGVVRIEALVRPNGAVKSTRVLGGNPVLVDAARDAVLKWRFETAPSETTETVLITFDSQ